MEALIFTLIFLAIIIFQNAINYSILRKILEEMKK
jgi:hypothetical protein